jgi:hypothetical protein
LAILSNATGALHGLRERRYGMFAHRNGPKKICGIHSSGRKSYCQTQAEFSYTVFKFSFTYRKGRLRYGLTNRPLLASSKFPAKPSRSRGNMLTKVYFRDGPALPVPARNARTPHRRSGPGPRSLPLLLPLLLEATYLSHDLTILLEVTGQP